MKIKIVNATKAGFIEICVGGVFDMEFPNSKTRRGRVIEDGMVSPTLDTGCQVGVVQTNLDGDIEGVMLDDGNVIHVRKLTPRECFRLQGWTDDYYEKAEFVNTDSQLYKQAGNGVTVNVIYEIAKKMT